MTRTAIPDEPVDPFLTPREQRLLSLIDGQGRTPHEVAQDFLVTEDEVQEILDHARRKQALRRGKA